MQKGLAMGQRQRWVLQCSIVCLVMVVHITHNRLSQSMQERSETGSSQCPLLEDALDPTKSTPNQFENICHKKSHKPKSITTGLTLRPWESGSGLSAEFLSFLKKLGRQKDKQNIQDCIISPEKTSEKWQPVKFLSQLKLLSFLKGRRLGKH